MTHCQVPLFSCENATPPPPIGHLLSPSIVWQLTKTVNFHMQAINQHWISMAVNIPSPALAADVGCEDVYSRLSRVVVFFLFSGHDGRPYPVTHTQLTTHLDTEKRAWLSSDSGTKSMPGMAMDNKRWDGRSVVRSVVSSTQLLSPSSSSEEGCCFC